MKLQAFTYYTNGKYKGHAEALGKSARALGIPFEAIERPHLDGWGENTRVKPLVMLEALERWVGVDVLFIDADAHIWTLPDEVLKGAHDVAGYFARYDTMYCGTMFFRNNDSARKLLRLWAHLLEEHKEWDDEEGLGLAIQTLKASVTVKRLPASYCWIDGAMRHIYPRMSPVIEHLTVGSIDERGDRAKLREERRKKKEEMNP